MMRSTLLLLVGLAFTACAAEPPAVPLPEKNTTVGKTPDAGTTSTSSSRFPTSDNTPTIPTSQPTDQTTAPSGTGVPTDTTTGSGGSTPPPPPTGGTTAPVPPPPTTSPETPKPTVSAFWTPASNGAHPASAVSGGAYSGEDAFICRVKTSAGAYAPGTLLPSEGVCFYTLGTVGDYSASYEVLAVSGGSATAILDFVAASNGEWPARSVKGGESNGRAVAVCAVATPYGVAYGQVGAGDPGCIFYGLKSDGEAVAVYMTSYWVLVGK